MWTNEILLHSGFHSNCLSEPWALMKQWVKPIAHHTLFPSGMHPQVHCTSRPTNCARMTEAQKRLMIRTGLKLEAEIKFTRTSLNLILLHPQHTGFKSRRYTLFMHVFTECNPFKNSYWRCWEILIFFLLVLSVDILTFDSYQYWSALSKLHFLEITFSK